MNYRIAIISVRFSTICFRASCRLIYKGFYASFPQFHLHITLFIYPTESKMIPGEAFQFARGVVIMSFPIFRPGFPPHWISLELHFISHLFHPWPLYAAMGYIHFGAFEPCWAFLSALRWFLSISQRKQMKFCSCVFLGFLASEEICQPCLAFLPLVGFVNVTMD